MGNNARSSLLTSSEGSLPFGDDGPATGKTDRLASILAGNEKAIAEALVNVVLRGGGMLLHGTKDGGAVALHVFYGDARQVRYASSAEALGALLDKVSGWTPAQPVLRSPTSILKRPGAR